MRPVGESARDTLQAQDVTPLVPGVGLDREREAEVLRRAGGGGDGGTRGAEA
jgi:hypothetical protein